MKLLLELDLSGKRFDVPGGTDNERSTAALVTIFRELTQQFEGNRSVNAGERQRVEDNGRTIGGWSIESDATRWGK